MKLLLCLTFLLFGVFWQPTAVVAADVLSPQVYQRAVQLFQKGQHAASEALFRRISRALQTRIQKHRKAGKSRHILILGQCDIDYYLAEIAWKRKRKRSACVHLQQMVRRLQGIPAQWSQWPIMPHLRKHVRLGRGRFAGSCSSVSSLLIVNVQPGNARLVYRTANNPTWRPTTARTIQLFEEKVEIKAIAKGYQPSTQLIFVPRWQTKAVAISLSKILVRLPPRPPIRPPPKPAPTAFYQTWWFWTVTGVVVAGAATGTILFFTLPRQLKVDAAVWAQP